MKSIKVLCLSAMVAQVSGFSGRLAADDDLPPPPPPALPSPADPARVPKPPRFEERAAELSSKARVLAGQLSAEAHAAADHARSIALDVRRNFRRGGEPNRTLVLPTEMGAPESLATGHEDLSVMARILRKAADRESRRPGYRSFNFSLGETGSQLDAMYLEGYGAVFLLNADYPLTAPPQPEAAKPAVKETDTTWERTKREVRGRVDEDEDDTVGLEGEEGFWVEDGASKYDAERVNGLQRRLIESLKHSKNLRNLRENEHVTVIVFGKSTGKRTQVGRIKRGKSEDAVRVEDGESGAPGVSMNIVGYVNADAVRQSTLVIRAKKSDINRYAAGELSAEDFTRQLSVSTF